MTREPRIVKDGVLSTLGGIDSGRSPSLLAPNQLSFAVNAVMRGGFPSSRPRLDEKTFYFADTEIEDWFEDHPLQGVEVYYGRSGDTRIIVAVGGRIFALAPKWASGAERFEVIEITPTITTTTTASFTVPAVDSTVAISVTDGSKIFAGYPLNIKGKLYVVTAVSGNTVTARNETDTPTTSVGNGSLIVFLDPNTPTLPLVWMEQAEQYMVIQDGQAAAILYDGATCRRADVSLKEVPTGTAMVYNEEIGRLCVAVSDNDVAIGDIVSRSNPAAVITFEEETILATGGRFRMPLKFGRIVAMEMTANLNRANGQGPMIVFAERGLSTFMLPAQRLAWQNVTYPVQVNMPLASATSQGSTVMVNSDVYYRSRDGLRSFVFAVQQFGAPGNVPISSELDRVFESDDEPLLAYSSAVLFHNRLLMTASPAPSTNGPYHRGLVALDFNLVSRMGFKAPPAYDGMWTGLKFTRLIAGQFDGKDRCFAFALNADNLQNELWEVHRETGFDEDDSRITSSIETRALDFRSPLELKELQNVAIWVDQVIGTVNFTLQYRPDDLHCWVTHGTKEICQAFEDCSEDDCKPLRTFNPGYRTRIDFGMPPDDAEIVDAKPARNFYHAQLRLTWTGQCRVRKVLARARQIEEPPANVDKEQ